MKRSEKSKKSVSIPMGGLIAKIGSSIWVKNVTIVDRIEVAAINNIKAPIIRNATSLFSTTLRIFR